MRFLVFLTDLIDPVNIRKYKKMTVFFALLIFFVSFFLLLLPQKLYLKNHSDYTASVYDYTYALYNIKDSANQFDSIKSKGYKIVNKQLTSNVSDEINQYTFLYTYEENNTCVYLIFDNEDLLNEKIEDVRSRYDMLYKSESERDNKNQICQMSYLDSIESLVNLDEVIKKYHDMDKESLNEIVSKTPYYRFYGIKELASNNNYGYIFTKDSVIRVLNGENDIYSYAYLDFDISKYNDLSSFSKDISVQMVSRYNEYLFDRQVVFVFLYTILLPVIVSLIIYMFTFKRKKLDGMLEYYKILSLETIIPTIISSVFIFVFGPGATKIFIALFLVYSMLMLYRSATNETKEEHERNKKNNTY